MESRNYLSFNYLIAALLKKKIKPELTFRLREISYVKGN